MKHIIYISILLIFVACSEKEQPRKVALSKKDTAADSLTPNVEEKQDFKTDEEPMAAFAIVSDADGYSVVRNSPSTSGKVIDKLQNGSIVFCMAPAGEWIGIDYYGKDLGANDFKTGFIHKSRLLLIDKYSKVTNLVTSDNAVVLGDDDINITVTQKAFDKSAHTLKQDAEQKYLETIDDNPFWGTDGSIPKRRYKSISINLNGIETTVPQRGLAELYEPNLENTSANYDSKNDVLYIQSFNSDGAGGYLVLWRIEKGAYKDRWVYNGF